MQFDADHLFALAGYAVADPDIMENHVRNGVPAIAEREYADTIEVLRMFKGDAEWAWLVEKLRSDVRKLFRAVRVYRSELSRLAAYPATSAGGSAARVPPSSCEPTICRSNVKVLPLAGLAASREQPVVGIPNSEEK